MQDLAGQFVKFLLHGSGFVEEFAVMLFALAEGLLGSPALGGVAADGINDLFIQRRRGGPLRPPVRTVFVADADFIGKDGRAGFQPLEFRRGHRAILRVHQIQIGHLHQIFG